MLYLAALPDGDLERPKKGDVQVQAVFKSGVYLPDLDLWLDSTKKRWCHLAQKLMRVKMWVCMPRVLEPI